MPSNAKHNIVMMDTSLAHERMLHYKERHQGWHIFRTLYWSIYFIAVGMLLVYYNSIAFTLNLFLGTASMLLALMLLYGLTEALHHKLMKKYG